MKLHNHIEEANRYITNAKEILEDKAKKVDGYYTDKKYVKLAGHAAYSGVLVALDGLLETPKKNRKNVNWYKEQLAKKNKKALNYFLSAYDTLHLAMGYDGNSNSKVAQAGIEDAEKIIHWINTVS